MVNILLVIVILFSNLSQALASESRYFYRVHKKDTASEILYKSGLKPIYGKNGTLVKLTRNNDARGDLNKIYPGQKIYFTEALAKKAESEGRVTITEDGEVLFIDSPRSESVNIATNETNFEKTESDMSAPIGTQSQVSADVSREITNDAKNEISPSEDEAVHERVLHRIEFIGGYRFTTISATDAVTSSTADINSSRDVEAGAAWIQRWSQGWGTFGSFSLRNIGFEPTLKGTKSLETLEKSLGQLNFGVIQHLGENFVLKYSAGYSQEMFVKGLDSSKVAVDSVALPNMALNAKYRFFTKDKTSLSAQAEARHHFSGKGSGYTVKAGQRFYGGVNLTRQFTKFTLEMGVGYFHKQQDTSLAKQKEFGPVGTIGISLPIGE